MPKQTIRASTSRGSSQTNRQSTEFCSTTKARPAHRMLPGEPFFRSRSLNWEQNLARGEPFLGGQSILPQLLSLRLAVLLELISFRFRPLLLVFLLVVHSLVVG